MTGRFIEYKLEQNDVSSVAATQSVKANTPFILNGKLGKSIDNIVVLSKNGFSYYVMLESSKDLSTVNFVVTGYHNGKLVTLRTTGPEAAEPVMDNTVLFDSITSITIDQDVVDPDWVRVGSIIAVTQTELVTYSVPIMIDFPYRKDINCIVSVCEPDNEGTFFKATYTLFVSQKDIANNQKTMSEMEGNELLSFREFTSDKPYCEITQAFRCCVLQIKISSEAALIIPNTILRFSQSN